MRKGLRFAIHLLFYFLIHIGFAQSIPDPSSLTDDQLRKAVEKARSSGYTEEQLITLAKARGVSSSDIATLRQRIMSLSMVSDTTANGAITGLRSNSLLEETNENTLSESTFFDQLLLVKQDTIFGANLFKNRQLTFAPSQNIPTPVDYQLGPGDELIIDIWGASENTYQLLVGPEGSIRIPKLGPVYVSGLTIEKAAAKVIARLTQIYAGLTDSQYGQKNTYAQVSLGQLRSIQVNVIGEINTPGTYTISSLSTVMHALYLAGGPGPNGSYRNIEVYRNSQKLAVFDVYDYLLKGDLSSNIRLQDQDILRVPVYAHRVKISGEIKTPAIYELEEKNNLSELLDLAGGFSDQAYRKHVTVLRKTETARSVQSVMNTAFNNFVLRSGDEVQVGKLKDQYENNIILEGAVWRPGIYQWQDTLALRDLLLFADGMKEDAFLARGVIKRYNNDLTLSNVDFNVTEVMAGIVDLPLQPRDEVMIKSIFDLRDSLYVFVQGEVRKPQRIVFRDSLTVEDVIFLTGGFKESAARSKVEVARRTNESNSSDVFNESLIFSFEIDETLGLIPTDASFKLLPFDIVSIRQSPYHNQSATVTIEGEVYYPGKYVMERKNERISEIIARAQGLTPLAYAKGATLIRRSEYFAQDEALSSNVARLKRKEIEDLLAQEEGLSKTDQKFKMEEFVGIDLMKALNNPGSKADLVLRAGDIISIPREINTVRVRGEVLYPGTVRYSAVKSFRSVMSLAGGATDQAKLRKAYVIYPNGEAQKTKSFLGIKLYPEIQPGTEIIIPSKSVKERISVQEVLGITSSLATIALIIDRLSN